MRFHVYSSVFFVAIYCSSAVLAQNGIREYRDTKPTIDVIDPIRVLSADKAGELEEQIKVAYGKLAPSVVRIWRQLPKEDGTDENGNPRLGGSGSGVIIGKDGLILTCAHSGMAPKTAVTIELADGRRVKGITLGRFELYDPQTSIDHPDLALARIEEEGDWPAAEVGPQAGPAGGEICLGIGYPGGLPMNRPPLLRLGRVMPPHPEWPWLLATTTYAPGDSGGPLFDVQGRVLGVVHGGDFHAAGEYEAVAPLYEHRDRLIAGEIVAAPRPGIRARRGRPIYSPPFAPAIDLEDTVLSSPVMVVVRDGANEVALGTIVNAEGWVVTKRSLVDGCHDLNCSLTVTYSGNLFVPARVAASSVEHDLALLKLEGREAPGAPGDIWASAPAASGQLVASLVGRSRAPVQFSVVGAEVNEESAGDVPQIFVDVQEGPSGEAVIHGLPQFALTPEADGFRHAFKPGDVLTQIDGKATPTYKDYVRVVQESVYASGEEGEFDYSRPATGSFAGEPVILTVRRDGKEIPIRIIKVHSSNASPLLWILSPRSIRRDGFPAVFTHDGRLRPDQCGGPVVDLAGRVVGVNIARADSTRTLAIPADVVQKVVAELIERAKQAEAIGDGN